MPFVSQAERDARALAALQRRGVDPDAAATRRRRRARVRRANELRSRPGVRRVVIGPDQDGRSGRERPSAPVQEQSIAARTFGGIR